MSGSWVGDTLVSCLRRKGGGEGGGPGQERRRSRKKGEGVCLRELIEASS